MGKAEWQTRWTSPLLSKPWTMLWLSPLSQGVPRQLILLSIFSLYSFNCYPCTYPYAPFHLHFNLLDKIGLVYVRQALDHTFIFSINIFNWHWVSLSRWVPVLVQTSSPHWEHQRGLGQPLCPLTCLCCKGARILREVDLQVYSLSACDHSGHVLSEFWILPPPLFPSISSVIWNVWDEVYINLDSPAVGCRDQPLVFTKSPCRLLFRMMGSELICGPWLSQALRTEP